MNKEEIIEIASRLFSKHLELGAEFNVPFPQVRERFIEELADQLKLQQQEVSEELQILIDEYNELRPEHMDSEGEAYMNVTKSKYFIKLADRIVLLKTKR